MFLFHKSNMIFFLFQCCLFLFESLYTCLINSIYLYWVYIFMVEHLINTNKITMENLCNKVRADSISLILALTLSFEPILFFIH